MSVVDREILRTTRNKDEGALEVQPRSECVLLVSLGFLWSAVLVWTLSQVSKVLTDTVIDVALSKG